MSETRAVDEAPLYSEQFLMTAVPDLLVELWRRDSREADEIVAALRATGFTVDDSLRTAAERKATVFRFRLAEPGDKTFERRLRAAITKRLGKATGDDRAWNIGRFRAGVISSGKTVDMRLSAEYATTELRAAAVDWIAGMDAAEWAVRHRFVDDSPANERAADASRAEFSPRSAEVHLHDEHGPRASLLVPATVRAPDALSADSEKGFAALIDYLSEALGASATPGSWEREGRSFTLRSTGATSRRPYLKVTFETTSDAASGAASGRASGATGDSPRLDQNPAARVRSDAKRYSPDQLLAAIPALIEDLWKRDSREPEAVLDALHSAQLTVDDDERASATQGHAHFRFRFDPAPDDGFERQLRSAITKRVGKHSGTDRHWNIGQLTASLTVSGRGVGVHLHPEYSAAELRDAAADWLQGADAAAWAARHRYIDDRPALERTADSPSPFSPSAVTVYLHATTGPRASFFLAPGVRAPGSLPADDDARFASVVEYLVEALGPASGDGRWVRENRAFTLRRMRSRTRVVEFTTI
ncbi:hypothetical protein [Microbacterium sp. NPDC087665]|uniref:hypothetical protein n=1 Tax=Microbacterium sp. NPDC087665 TaxID=3364194 RepID=UPI0037FABCEC